MQNIQRHSRSRTEPDNAGILSNRINCCSKFRMVVPNKAQKEAIRMKWLSIAIFVCLSLAFLSENGRATIYVYQENLTNIGGDNLGSYLNNGTEFYDGNWSTFTYTLGNGNFFIYINYSKPVNLSNPSLWQVKDGLGTFNLTIPETCVNYYSDRLELRVESGNEPPLTVGNHNNWWCQNGSWALLRNGISEGARYLYEEAMWWNEMLFKPENMSIVPSPALISDDLNCSYNFYTDDASAYTQTGAWFQWFINDIVNTNTSQMLGHGNLSNEANVTCSVKVEANSTINSSWYNSSTLTVNDSISPVLNNFTTPSSAYTDESVAVTADCADKNSNIDWVKLQLTYPAGSGITSINSSMQHDSSNTYSVSVAPVYVGTYTLSFFCSDSSGNKQSNLSTGLSLVASTRPATTSGGGGSPPPPKEEEKKPSCDPKLFDYFWNASNEFFRNAGTSTAKTVWDTFWKYIICNMQASMIPG